MTTAEAFLNGLQTPLGESQVPRFDCGWFSSDETSARPFISYAEPIDINWSDDLEELHKEGSRDHFIEILTRGAVIQALQTKITSGAIIADLGCSTGYLLADLANTFAPELQVGVDMISSGLNQAHASCPETALMVADTCDLPFADSSVDAAVSVNVLEHVADDGRALREVARILRPGGTAVIVVPAGPHLYDYYDEFLTHERRYGRGELAGKARAAGLLVERDGYLGSIVYPPFFAVKKVNRWRFRSVTDERREALVKANIDNTQNSRLGMLATKAELHLFGRGINLPFGIRNITVLTKPQSGSGS